MGYMQKKIRGRAVHLVFFCFEACWLCVKKAFTFLQVRVSYNELVEALFKSLIRHPFTQAVEIETT